MVWVCVDTVLDTMVGCKVPFLDVRIIFITDLVFFPHSLGLSGCWSYFCPYTCSLVRGSQRRVVFCTCLHQAKVNGRRCHWTRFGEGPFKFSFNIYCFFFWPFHIILSLHWHGKPQRQPRVRRHDDEVRCWQSCVIQKVGWWWLSFCRNWFGYGWSTITGSKWFENNYCLQT